VPPWRSVSQSDWPVLEDPNLLFNLGQDGLKNTPTLALFRCTQMILWPKA
jgi:hypothetical protein